MSFWEKFCVCHILFIILLWRLHYVIAFPSSDITSFVAYIITIISVCLITFDIIYITLRIILKIVKNIKDIHMVNKNNDD